MPRGQKFSAKPPPVTALRANTGYLSIAYCEPDASSLEDKNKHPIMINPKNGIYAEWYRLLYSGGFDFVSVKEHTEISMERLRGFGLL